jgi:hypothetical protein
MFLTFKNLPDVKQTHSFCHVIFSRIRGSCEEEVNGGHIKVGDRAHHVGQKSDRMVGPIWRLKRLFDAILVSIDSA